MALTPSGFSRGAAADDRTHRVRAQPDTDLVLARRAWIELDPVRGERDTVEGHAGNACRHAIGILDDDVNALPPDVDPGLESFPERRIGRTEPLFKGRPRSTPCETALLLRLTVR